MDEIDTAAVRQFVANGDAFLPDGPKTAILPAIVLEAIADEIDALRARLDAVEAERDEAIAGRKLDLQGAASYFELHQDIWRKGADNLRARLAEVEAERDRLIGDLARTEGQASEAIRAEACAVEELEVRLAAVEALCDNRDGVFTTNRQLDAIRAAARGEGDRG